LMAEFVGWIGVGADVIGDGAAVSDLWHRKNIASAIKIVI
jgi:hypothetical protein